MPQTDTLHVKLSPEALKFVQDKVASGEFASESDVLNESVEILMDRSEEQARWEQEVLLPAHDRFLADPSSAIPFEEVERYLEACRRERSQAR